MRNSVYKILVIFALVSISFAESTPVPSGVQTTTGTAETADHSPGSSAQPAEKVYEVATDGSKQYSTIQAALDAATDPNVDKTILVYPGEYKINNDVRLDLTVPRTTLRGVDKSSVHITGSIPMDDGLGDLQGLINVLASNCTIADLTVTNRSKSTDIRPTHSTAITLGSNAATTDDLLITNCVINAKADKTSGELWAYDAIWSINCTDSRIENCQVNAYSDIISAVNTTLNVSNSKVNCKVTSGGIAFWIQASKVVITNVETTNIKAPYSYIVFSNKGAPSDVVMTNVTETVAVSPVPDFYTSNPTVASSLKLKNVLGKWPPHRGVVVGTILESKVLPKEETSSTATETQRLK